jgi:glycosyltransferase involved in cell wall biosynthesis
MLETMQSSTDERSALGRAARERIVQHFDMNRKADEWEALYRSVLGHSPPEPSVIP